MRVVQNRLPGKCHTDFIAKVFPDAHQLGIKTALRRERSHETVKLDLVKGSRCRNILRQIT
jgi:hypothetical protein